MAELGYFSLVLSLFISVYAVFIDILGVRFGDRAFLESGRNSVYACWLSLCVAMAMLFLSLARCDFGIEYVVKHTSRSLPVSYRLCALWAGAFGSLLLWLWMQTGIVALVLHRDSHRQSQFPAVARAMANVVSVFFLVVLLLDKNPFALSPLPYAEGAGLNPLLQHPAMILHPPTLFAGYAAYIIPFAWAIAVLACKPNQPGASFLATARNWMLIAWLFLTAGNVLGSWWAYEELGWGGFWGWDPVENSSLMPWLAGAALLHSFKKYRTGSLWVIILCLITYSLCVFGTFLTRYGLLSSVHAFPKAGWGILFLFLIIVVWIIAAVLLIRRHKETSQNKQAFPVRGDFIMTLTNWLFILLVLVIFIGTLFPFFSGLVSSGKITLQPEYFTKITSPGGLALLLLLGLCPHFFRRGFNSGWRILPGIVTAFVAVSTWSIFQRLAVPCFVICGFVAINLIADFLTGFRPVKTDDEKTAPRRLPLSWYGSRLAHLGVLLMFFGIAGAEGYGIERQVALKPGQSVVAGKYSIRFDGIDYSTGPNFKVAAANLSVSKNDKNIGSRKPALAYYDNNQRTSEVDVRRTLLDDLYIALTAVGEGGRLINLRILVKPLINWLWIGAVIMEIGAIMVLISRLRRRKTIPTDISQTL